MKAIMMSIRQGWAAKILNKEKTIEIRKRFPIDYVGWVYIYCTKNGALLFKEENTKTYWAEEENKTYRPHYALNGKVVARFWCDKVEEHKDFGMFPYSKLRYNKATCLNEEEIEDYGFIDGKGFVPLYAIHINDLEIFNKPKEISEFKHLVKYTCKTCPYNHEDMDGDICSKCCETKPLNRAPQNYYYVEI